MQSSKYAGVQEHGFFRDSGTERKREGSCFWNRKEHPDREPCNTHTTDFRRGYSYPKRTQPFHKGHICNCDFYGSNLFHTCFSSSGCFSCKPYFCHWNYRCQCSRRTFTYSHPCAEPCLQKNGFAKCSYKTARISRNSRLDYCHLH